MNNVHPNFKSLIDGLSPKPAPAPSNEKRYPELKAGMMVRNACGAWRLVRGLTGALEMIDDTWASVGTPENAVLREYSTDNGDSWQPYAPLPEQLMVHVTRGSNRVGSAYTLDEEGHDDPDNVLYIRADLAKLPWKKCVVGARCDQRSLAMWKTPAGKWRCYVYPPDHKRGFDESDHWYLTLSDLITSLPQEDAK